MSTPGWSRRGAGVLLAALICAVLAGSGFDSTVSAQSPVTDYDSDDDGLIEVTSEDQLNAMRWDLDGNGAVDASANATDYAAAFPTPAQRMGCPTTGCTGYEVATNISLSSNPDWEPIGNTTTNFTATFEGNAPSYTITNLTINRSADYAGLFGVTGTRSAIRNVKLTGVDVRGRDYVGALAGRTRGTIDNCETTGSVTGRWRVGGLIGLNDGTITASASSATVTSQSGGYAGGLVGENRAAIEDSSASGAVRAPAWAGGLVGLSTGPIAGSTASGAVTATRTDGSAFAGGLAGRNLDATVIRNSHASGDVTGSQNTVGGLVGSNYDAMAWNGSAAPRDAISGSTARGTVTTTGNNAGGLAGWNNGPVRDSYAGGAVQGGSQRGGLAVSAAIAAAAGSPGLKLSSLAVSTTREVAENTAAGVDIGAPVVATDSSGTVTYTLGGTDAASFDIDAATGQLETRAALDYETRSSYEVTVTATDSDGTTDIAVTINVTNVIELTAITGPTSATFGESGWGRVATFTASSDQDRDGVNWILSGDDAGQFSIDSPAGALRFHIDPVSPNLFRQPPDFENPVDADRDNSYQVTVVANVGANSSAPISLTVTVIDEDENGQITLSTTKPRVGQALTASLSDPDTVSGTVVWTWERSAGRNRWVAINGATHSSYTPVAADSGEYLRITATYGDGHGTGKSVSKALHNVVIADRLASLSVTTNDSTGAASWRQMRPAFDAETLHYSIGCGDSDSMSLTFAAADAQNRLSVDGAAYVNPGAEQSLTAAVAVRGQSDVTISVSNAIGAETQYVVHCMADDFGEFTSVKSAGATEELLLVPRDSYLLILDNNAVPRFRRHLVDHEAQTYFRFYPNGGNGEYRYSYSVAHNRGHVILDENLEEIGRASTISPVTSNDSHDFRVLDNGNYLLMTYQPGIRDFSFLTFLDSNGAPFGTDVRVSESWIQIVKPTNTALLSWNSWDHMPLEDCTHHWFPPAFGRWAHVNSIEMTGGEIVASFRGCNRILGIDPSTGNVNWRIGPTNLSDAEWASSGKGPAPMDIVGDPQIQFCGQHAASILPNGNLLLYDNGANCSRNPWTGENLVRPDRTYGRAVEYYLDFEHDEVVYVREHSLNGTKNYIGWVRGNVSALENGDWLISWGVDRLAGNAPIPDGPPFSVNVDVTQVDPATGEEVLSLDWNPDAQEGRRVTAMPAYALARQPRSLVATFPGSSTTSMLHSGATDRPQVLVTFNHPIADFDQTSPSLWIQGATVESIRSHVVNGESANSYVITLVPDGDRTITVRLLPNQACSLNGICIANGTMLSEVPDALVIEPPVITLASAAGGAVTVSGSAVSVEENHTSDLVNVTATDPESTHTDYTLALGGTHSTSFTLSSTGGAGVLSFTNPPDHEVREVYRLTLTASNASESSTRDVTVTVRDVDEPADISFVATGGVTVNDNALTVDENHDGTLATFSARDPENDQTLTYTWSTDPPDHFVIRGGVLSFKNIPDYELPAGGTTSYDIAVSALDSGGMTGSIAVTVTVTNVDEPPEITLASAAGSDVTVDGSAVSVDENHTGDLVDVTATDPETTHTDYTLALGGTHSTSFTLNTGVLSFTNPPDHEARVVYDLTLTASNASESSTLAVTVTVRDVNDPPVISGATEVNLNEVVDPTTGQVVRVDTYTKSDPDRPLQTTNWGPVGSSQVLSGADRDTFEFDQLTGMLTFASPPDYENGGGEYQLTLTANDGADPGTLDVTVNVANVEEAGTLALGARRGVNGEALVATLTDPDTVATQTWKWQRSTSGTSGWTDIANADSNSYTPGADDVGNYLRASVTYTDGTGPDETTLTADTEFPTDNDASTNQPPTPPDPLPQVAAVAENAPAGRNVVQVVFTDPEGEHPLRYTLSGSDEFAIGSSSGLIVVRRGGLDYEETTSYSVTVSAADSYGAAGMVTLRIPISDVNEPPGITLASAAGGAVTVDGSAVSVEENHAGDLVGVTATDPETTHTDYTLVLGGTHSTSFTLNTGVLSFTNPPDHEARVVYDLTLTASNASESSTLDVTVTVRDVDEPADISFVATGGVTVNDNALTVDENHDGTLATFRARDPENDQTLTYTWSTDPPDHFVIRAGVLSFKNIPDYELPAGGTTSYDIAVSALDSGGMTGSIAVTVTVTNVDEPPEITLASAAGGDVTVSGSAVSVDENHAGDLVGVTATDPETTHTDYTLVLGGTHSTSFTLNTGVLSFTNPPDHEARVVYDLTLTASNAMESSTLAVTVTVRDVNDPPVISGATEVNLNEVVDPTPGQVVRVGAYRKSDPDRPLQTTNWGPLGSSQVLSGADRDTFEFDQLTGMLTFASPPDYENGGGEYQLTLTANDGADPGTLDVTVNVANVEEAGTLALGARRGVNGEALVATLTDPDNVVSETWQWQHSMSRSGPWTDIANTDASSYTPTAADVGNYLRASVSYTDGAGPDETTLTADTEFPTDNDASTNQPPTPPDPLPQVADVAENAPAGRNVVQVVFTDPEREQQLTYSLSGSDEFAIGSSSGLIVVRSGGLNYEEATSHSVTVRAEDSYGSAATVTITIGISDVNEAPTAADFVVTVPEDETVDIDVVEMASDEDAADTLDTLTVAGVVRHPEAGTVAVNVGTNDITYTPRANYHGSDNFTYQVKDGAGLSSNIATVAITIDPVNDAPTVASSTTTRRVSENARAGDDVGERVIATDIDGDSLTYSLFGIDAASFEIDSNGQITVAARVIFDITMKSAYEVSAEARDEDGETATVDVTITVVAGPVAPPSGGGGGFAGGGGGGGGGGGPSPSVVDFEWTVSRDIEDLDGGHDKPSGTWSDGATLWVLENGAGADDAIYAYDLATGERVEDREFALDERNRAPRGVWSDRTVLWVSDSGRNRLFAHDLESGERLEERDIALAGRNRDARGIWSGDETMWVLDGGKDSLFAYDLATGDLLAEYELASANGDPHGVWSDGVSVWVSDHGAKRLFAYRLPARPEAPAAEDAEPQDLERVSDEEFKELSKASNNSPRGLWSDGDVMYVADESDAKVYSYNMPNAIDARLSSLTLSGVDFGEFDRNRTDYEGTGGEGVTATTVEAEALQRRTSVAIDPPDIDEAAEGHQVALDGVAEIAVTVTSADGSRERVYRVRLSEPEQAAASALTFDCFRGDVAVGFSLVVYGGGSVGDLVACAEGRNVTALYALESGEYVSYILGAPEFVNEDFRALFADGVPALTPLTVKSDGPATADPAPEGGVAQPWPECLQGEIVEGFNLVVYEGGSVGELEACARDRNVTAVYTLNEGEYVSYILGAPDFVNQAFAELFADGVPAVTPLVAQSDSPLTASADGGDATEN